MAPVDGQHGHHYEMAPLVLRLPARQHDGPTITPPNTARADAIDVLMRFSFQHFASYWCHFAIERRLRPALIDYGFSHHDICQCAA